MHDFDRTVLNIWLTSEFFVPGTTELTWENGASACSDPCEAILAGAARMSGRERVKGPGSSCLGAGPHKRGTLSFRMG